MSRLHLTFGCGSLKLAGTLDMAPGKTGLLWVSGGNEIRSGAFSGQSHIAANIAGAGFPVFRFDRRGVGDSEGENRGFQSSQGDIEAAIHAFQAMAPQLDAIVAFGNCDAASALMLAQGATCDRLVLSNPWTIENENESEEPAETMPASAIRARYLEKLASPREVWRLISGGVDLRKLAKGLSKSVTKANSPNGLAEDMRAGIGSFEGEVRFLIAESDRTAQAFLDVWDPADQRISRCKGASHAYVEPHARDWLVHQLLDALRS